MPLTDALCFQTTDGVTVWSQCGNGGNTILRTDERPFGSCKSAYRQNVFCPHGVVMGLASARNAKLNTTRMGFTTIVMVATQKGSWLPGSMDEVTFLDGYDSSAKELARVAFSTPVLSISLEPAGGWLYALHGERTVSKLQLTDGLPEPNAKWSKVFDIAAAAVPTPAMLSVGTSQKFVYVSDTVSNLVAQLSGTTGNKLRNLGSSQLVPVPLPVSGTYISGTMMGPRNVAVWSRPDGDHILVLETLGPARIGQWDSAGKLEREWTTPQSKANYGWALDPDSPNHASTQGLNFSISRGASDSLLLISGVSHAIRFYAEGSPSGLEFCEAGGMEPSQPVPEPF